VPAPQSSRSTGQEKAPAPDGDNARQQSSVDTPPNSGEEATRSVKRTEPRVSLQDVRSIFVEVKANESSAQALRDVLVERLQAGARLTLSKGRDDADALLKVTAGSSSSSKSTPLTFAIQLINPQGQVIWPVNGGSRAYSASSVQVVGIRIVQDLLADINKDRRRQ
jgi:hypothetical protein